MRLFSYYRSGLALAGLSKTVRSAQPRSLTTRALSSDSRRQFDASAKPGDLPQKYFVTTPIFYVNAAPHIGHLYTALLSDAISRWYKILGVPVTFSTGTDEHGLKIQQAAAQKGMQPDELCDKISAEFKRLFEHADIQYTDYIRTTEQRHREAVEKLWSMLQERGHIYKGSYEGWYCTSDEAFLSSDQVNEVKDTQGQMIKVSAESGHPVEWMKEDNYMFRLSEFGPHLTEWLNQKVINPPVFEPIVRGWVETGLPDLSVSRSRERLQWGIPVPGDDSQTIYVWLDALVNYLTVAGFPDSPTAWPADCHIVGKDILRFHAVYWPAFLMAAGLQPPRSILCHSHWKVDDKKMSKSLGNVVDPFATMAKFTQDAVRYFLLTQGVPHSDGNFVEKKVPVSANADLKNKVGNLVSRCVSDSLNPRKVFPAFDAEVFEKQLSLVDQKVLWDLENLPAAVDSHYREFNFYKGIELVMTQLKNTNAFLTRRKPWELVQKTDNSVLVETILHVAMESVRVSLILLQPVVPSLSSRTLDLLNVPKDRRGWADFKHDVEERPLVLGLDKKQLFPRLKVSKQPRLRAKKQEKRDIMRDEDSL